MSMMSFFFNQENTRLSSQALDTSQVVNKEDPQVAHWAKIRTIEQ